MGKYLISNFIGCHFKMIENIWYIKELTLVDLLAGLYNLTMKFTNERVRKVVAEIRISETREWADHNIVYAILAAIG